MFMKLADTLIRTQKPADDVDDPVATTKQKDTGCC
jgi:hypothetical protein